MSKKTVKQAAAKKAAKRKAKRIVMPKVPRLPKHPSGHELTAQAAQALIEEVSQREWGIGWQEFRRRWNHGEFTDFEREQLRLIARLLAFAVLPPDFAE